MRQIGWTLAPMLATGLLVSTVGCREDAESPTGPAGDGTTTQRLTPVAVAGGRTFAQLSAGYQHTCGRTPAGVGRCGGENSSGQLGDGTINNSSISVAVAGP